MLWIDKEYWRQLFVFEKDQENKYMRDTFDLVLFLGEEGSSILATFYKILKVLLE